MYELSGTMLYNTAGRTRDNRGGVFGLSLISSNRTAFMIFVTFDAKYTHYMMIDTLQHIRESELGRS